ncbi:MAG TPA: biopolymer transporter ExbD [Bacillota bacterium]|nr:biopolymer transporter ExbD [Bacillota bacterium]
MLKKPARRGPEIQLTTFVDVLFNLLAFFLIFAALKWAVPSSLGVDLPHTPSGEGLLRNKGKITVVMNDKGSVQIEGRTVPDSRLALVLHRLQSDKTTTVIWAARDLRYEKVITLLSIVRANGGRRVRLAVLPDDAQ